MEIETETKPLHKRSKSASTRIGGRIMRRKKGIEKLKNRSSSRKRIVEKSASALKKKVIHQRIKGRNNDHRANKKILLRAEDPQKLKRMRQIELSLRRNKPRSQINLEKRLKGYIKEIAGIEESLKRMKKNVKYMSRFKNGGTQFFADLLKKSFNELLGSRKHFIEQYGETQLEYDPVPQFTFFAKKKNIWFESELKQKSVSSSEDNRGSLPKLVSHDSDSVKWSMTNDSIEGSMEDSREDTQSGRTSLIGATSVDEDSDSSMLALSEYYSGESFQSSIRDTTETRMTNLEVIPEHDSEASSDKGSKSEAS